ncbi:hypothetical protein ACIQPT_25535 [Streptomyces sp. NPDC091289]|uniref:hypothetical protein n=1 Tax=Streptomyces sp. NPDC091289 TaxID=3365989 RepID=UPI003805E854
MQIAGVDIYVNHPVLHLGATDWVPLSLALDAAPAASCATHVAVRVRPQRGLIKVRLFTPPDDLQVQRPDPAFTTVFHGPLLLSDGRIAVGDVEQQTRFVHRVGDRGQFNVRVAVNAPGPEANAIDIVIAGSSK